MTTFLSDIILSSANDIQFKNSAGTNTGKIESDGNNLVLSNAVGDILLGDGASDVYIGDGTNNVDILFEQSGSIKADDSATGVTITLGSSNTTIAFGGAVSFGGSVTSFSGSGVNTVDLGASATPFLNLYAAHHVGGNSINYATSRGWVEDSAPLSSTQVGEFGGNFVRNGTAAENAVVRGQDPFNNKALLWKAIGNTSDDNDDGGWNKDITIPANNDIGYLSYVYFKADFTADSGEDGQLYLGCGTTAGQTINISDDSNNTNPYFVSNQIFTINNGSPAVANRWYLMIGVIQPYNDETTGTDTISGVYDVETGEKVFNGAEFKMGNNTTAQRHRTYLYYQDSNSAGNVYFWNPGFHAIDGSEPKLQDLLKRQTIANTVKVGRDADNLIDFTTDNRITFRVQANNELGLEASALYPVTSDGLSLGYANYQWADLFLASGSVINFNNGDVTLTHSGNNLAIAGGNLEFTGYGIVMDGNTITGIDDSDEFTDNDNHIMTSAAVQDKILSYSYTTNTGDATLAGTQTFTGEKTFSSKLTVNTAAGAEEIEIYNENDTSPIADTFSGNTSKSYINFVAVSGSNDPGYIMHETSASETNEGVLHLCPSDDNSEGDYVSIHGTNDADVIKLHTDGLIETANLQLELKSGSGDVLISDNVDINGNIDVSGTATFGGELSIPTKITHVGDTTTWIGFDDGDDTLRVVTGATERFHVNNTRTRISNNDLQVNGDIEIKNHNGSNPTDAGSLFFNESGTTWGTDMYGFRINQEGSSNLLQFQSVYGDTNVNTILTLQRDNKTATFSGPISAETSTITAATFSGDLHGTINTATTATTQSASDNSTKVATTAYVDAQVATVVDSAPGTLNTLNELAAALGDDASFSTTVTNSIATKLPLAGGNMSGDIAMGNNNISGSGTVLGTSAKFGRDADNLIDFTTDNQIDFRVAAGHRLRLTQTALAPITTDAVSLGTSSLNFSDLFLDSGGVVNFDSGDVTVTHSSNKLTFDGASIVQINTPAANSTGQNLVLNRPAAGTHYSSIEWHTDGTVDWSIGQNSADNFEIFENGADATTRFTIEEGGNIGIGVTNPTQKLHVDGHALISAEKYYYVAGSGAGMGSDASGNLILRQNSADLMTTSGSNATFAGDIQLPLQKKLYFNNANENIFSNVNGDLQINARTELRIKANSNGTASTPLELINGGNVILSLDQDQSATFADKITLSSNKAVEWPGGSIRAEGNILKLVATDYINPQDIVSITAGGNASPSGVEGLHLMYDTNHAYIKSENNGSTNRPLTFLSSAYTFSVGNATFAGTIGSGAITSTGKITGTELEGTSLDINGDGDVSGTLTIGTISATNYGLASGDIPNNAADTSGNAATATTAGTVTTAAQGNITSVGTLTSLTVSGDLSIAQNIVHTGDTDTLIAFSTNQARITTGGTARLTAASTGVNIGKRDFNLSGGTAGGGEGDVVYFGDTESMTPGSIYHYTSSGVWELADASAVANCDGLLAVALGEESNSSGMLLRGMATLSADPGAVGDVLFVSETAGRATATAPTTSNAVVRVVGYCLHASNAQIWFNPDGAFVEVS